MFQLTQNQLKEALEFMTEQDKIVADKQKEKRGEMVPYYGCSGGGYSYIFTPTTLGLCVSIRNNLTKTEKNLTETFDW